jgi:hypothetical protein
MAVLTALKVKIGKKVPRGALFPDFNTLPVVVASGKDWSEYVDVEGSGWMYDKVGHEEEVPGSPRGEQWGMLLVPAAFAAEAAAAFPATCTVLSAVDAGTFYDVDVAGADDSQTIDKDVIEAIERQDKITPSVGRSPEQNKALDPLDPQPGVSPNRDKTLAGFTLKRGFTITP